MSVYTACGGFGAANFKCKLTFSKSVTLYGHLVTIMASQAAAHVRHLRRLAFTREVQQMAVKVVKYGCAAYCFRTYVMGVTAVSIVLPVCPSRIAGSVYCACLHVMYPCTRQTCQAHTLCSAVHRTKHVPNTEQQGRHPTAAVLAAVLPHQRRPHFAGALLSFCQNHQSW